MNYECINELGQAAEKKLFSSNTDTEFRFRLIIRAGHPGCGYQKDKINKRKSVEETYNIAKEPKENIESSYSIHQCTKTIQL